MWLFHVLMNKTASAVIIARLSADGTATKLRQSPSGKTIYFTTYPRVVNPFLKKLQTERSWRRLNPTIHALLNSQT